MQWLAACAVLLFVVVVVVQATPVPCRAEDLWPIVQRDVQLAFLYRDDRINGIRRALEFWEQRSWQFPQWPASWQPPKNQTWCDYGPSATTATQFLSASIPLTPSLYIILDLLLRYRHFEEGSVGCPASQIMQCDDATQQCECKCPPNALGNGVCTASTTASENGITTAAIILTSVLFGIILIGLIALIVILTRAMNAILSLGQMTASLPEPPSTSVPTGTPVKKQPYVTPVDATSSLLQGHV